VRDRSNVLYRPVPSHDHLRKDTQHSSSLQHTPAIATTAGRWVYLLPNHDDRYPLDLAALSSTLRSISSIFLSVSALALLAYDSVSCLTLPNSLSAVETWGDVSV